MLYCFLHGIANYRDIMYTVVLVENESYAIRHDTANRSGARPWVDVHCPWYHTSLLVNESSYLAVEDYGCVPETLSAATRLDGRLRSDHALNCGARSFYGPCLRERTVPRLSVLVVSGDRTLWNFCHQSVQYFLHYINYTLS